MVRQFTKWLGPTRTRLLIGSLIGTGLASLVLSIAAGDADWSLTVQTLLVLLFLINASLVIGSRLNGANRQRLFITIGPALGLVFIGIIVPNWFAALLGAAFGWLIAAQFFVRDPIRREYRTVIKYMRKAEYKEALRITTELINADKDNPEHYQFRAQLNRLAGKLDAAAHDYRRVINLSPEAASGYNGVAEVYVQQGNYEEARQFALEAYRLQPDYWITPYNLGMIDDRLGMSESAIQNLQVVIEKGLPDSRYRLLTYLWLARAYHRLGKKSEADEALQKMRRESKGLKEWQTIFEAEQGAVLKDLLEKDITLATRAFEGEIASARELFK